MMKEWADFRRVYGLGDIVKEMAQIRAEIRGLRAEVRAVQQAGQVFDEEMRTLARIQVDVIDGLLADARDMRHNGSNAPELVD